MVLIPHDPNIVKNQRSEVHVYSIYGDYLIGNHDAKYSQFEKVSNSLLVDVRTTFKEANIERGSYIIVINFFKTFWGKYGEEKVVVKEISPDRTEIKFQVDKKYVNEIGQFQSQVLDLTNSNILNNLVVNFGFNQIQKVINIRVENELIYVKLYQPIFDEVIEKDFAWFDFEVIDPYVDKVVLVQPIIGGEVNYLQGPNFDLDTNLYNSNSTPFKSWNDILDSNLPTNQRVIEQSLSGSSIPLNVDYTSFDNFVFYSSAEERLRNLHYKVSKIEEYSASISILQNSTASQTFYISSSVDLNKRRIDQITSNFTPFEKWVYYESTQSLFSHANSGSITPWPKRIYNGTWLNWSISSSIATTWYNTIVTSASNYDLDNYNRLYWAIPEHIYMDPGNADFILFVDLVGEHFDTLYAHIKALTKIHEKEEHPQRGVSGELLPHIAASFGWQLQNTKQLSDIWKYKLGVNQTGQYENTGSLFDIPGESQSHQIWRRIVNNLPYLLKTKGTSRSIKALMSIYGIPNTVISIKEYGGPAPINELPTLIEDHFAYRLKLSGSQYIEMNRRVIPAGSGSWGGVTRVPDTVEFRFNTEYSSSVSMSIWAIEDSASRGRANKLEIIHSSGKFPGTQSYSGSQTYGFLRYTGVMRNGSTFVSSSVSSSFLPLFDDDIWTVRIQTPNPLVDTNKSGSIIFSVAKQSDNLYGRISHSASFAWSGAFDSAYLWGGLSGSANDPHVLVLGGITGSNSNRFIGNIQAYKEYFEVLSGSNFNHHVLNPQAYHGNSETSSFYTLFRYYPLGLDTQRTQHQTYTQVSSSQPNRKASFDTTASFKGFTLSQSLQYDQSYETHYIYTPSLGGNLLRSEKIRLEETTLARDFSPHGRSETNAFDRSGFDTNRLAVVFDVNDYVNRDIYNHTGYVALDNWIADPSYEFEEGYSELNRFRHQYFQKYQQRNDVNALIRLLAIYDYTFFEQCKQLIPGRADAILGILIEDDVLHRNKVKLTKRPVLENLTYEKVMGGVAPTSSGENLYYEASASFGQRLEARYDYLNGSLQQILYLTGSSIHHTGSRDVIGKDIDTIPTRYSGSQTVTQSYVDRMRPNCCYKKVIYHYSSSGIFANQYEKQWYTAVSKSYGWYYSRSLECTSYQYQESCAVENRWRFGGTKLEGSDINVNSPNTIDGGPVVSIWEVNPNKLIVADSPYGGNLKVE